MCPAADPALTHGSRNFVTSTGPTWPTVMAQRLHTGRVSLPQRAARQDAEPRRRGR